MLNFAHAALTTRFKPPTIPVIEADNKDEDWRGYLTRRKGVDRC